MSEETLNNIDGVLSDLRSPIDIEKDYLHEEVIPMAVPLNWNRDISGCPKYSVRDQDGSFSCVGQGLAKALETITGVVQSAHPIYRRRGNFPNRGMYLQNAFDIAKHLGTTTESADVSQKIDESQMNRDIIVETPLKQPAYIKIDPVDIDKIATAIETQKHCVLTIVSNYQEWNVVKPVVLNNSSVTFGHAICGIYYFTDENGVKCIVVDESWGENNIRQRILTEDYIRARATGAMYFIPAVEPQPLPKPKFTFSKPLLYGQSNFSIKVLQDILKYENLFPLNITSTGNYLQITAKSVLAWQRKHKVASESELTSLMGKRVGDKTIKALNLIYS
jgi:hypothetical protein